LGRAQLCSPFLTSDINEKVNDEKKKEEKKREKEEVRSGVLILPKLILSLPKRYCP
jgi:hypothetical protein